MDYSIFLMYFLFFLSKEQSGRSDRSVLFENFGLFAEISVEQTFESLAVTDLVFQDKDASDLSDSIKFLASPKSAKR